MKSLIPAKEQQNFLDVLWQMLSNIEATVNPKKDILDKVMVEGAYDLLNRIGFTYLRPRWEPNISITERSIYRTGQGDTGVIRVFVPNDTTNYGYWLPIEVAKEILPSHVMELIWKNEEDRNDMTIECQVNESVVKIIKEKGNNPFAKKT